MRDEPHAVAVDADAGAMHHRLGRGLCRFSGGAGLRQHLQEPGRQDLGRNQDSLGHRISALRKP